MVQGQASADAGSGVWLAMMCAGRFGSTLIYMVYAACLPVLLGAWSMDATEAGTVHAGFSIGHGVSLVVVSWLSDHIGPRRVVLVSAWVSAAASLAFALLADSYVSALVLFTLVGLTVGGTYIPAVILASHRYTAARRGRAVGSLLASASLGYAASLGLSGLALAFSGYRMAFLLCALGGVLGAVAFTAALWGGDDVPPTSADDTPAPGRLGRSAYLLIGAYTAHAWELLGLWSWTPAFVAAAASAVGVAAASATGAWTIGLLHLTGFAASLYAGAVSDRLGRRTTILLFAAAGAALSFGIGWTVGAPLAVIVVLCAAYGFLGVGDSPVLSTAITEAVPARILGRVFAARSLLGFGIGGLASIAFGAVLDAMQGHDPRIAWGLAFAMLGVGGALAALCAALLPRSKRPA